MNGAAKKIWKAIGTVFVILIVALSLALVGVRLFGIKTYAVTSGSMEPTYHVGSLIYVKNVDTSSLKVGDAITFMLDEDTVATHRIVEIVSDDSDQSVLRFRTKGDANDTVDAGLVHYKNVIGKPVFSVPCLGYVADFVQHPPGLYIFLGGAAIILILVFLPDILGSSEEKKKNKKS